MDKILHRKLKIEQHEPTQKLCFLTPNKNQNDKEVQMWLLLKEVTSTTQLQARGRFTLILGYELFSLLKTLLWLWNVEQQYFTLICV
jgi:hypothetical protein